MGLLQLKTNLKDLKFGRDRVGGGSSNQPYLPDPLPNLNASLDNQNTDFLLRGGAIAPIESALDVVRLGKYFTDLKSPSGLFFIAKQNLLSRLAVKTQASGKIFNNGVYTPLSTLAQAGINAFGLHVNKQGLNPFPNGLGSLTTYSDVVSGPNQNQLGILTNILQGNIPGANRLVALYGVKIKQNRPIYLDNGVVSTQIDPVNLLSYPGGPGSILGIGVTNIKFADQRTGKANPFYGKNPNYQSGLVNSLTKRTPEDVKKPIGVSSFYSQLDPKAREQLVSTLTYVKTNPLAKSSNYQYVSGIGVNSVYSFANGRFGTTTVNESIEGALVYTQQELIDSKPFQYSAVSGLTDFRNKIRERIKNNEAAKALGQTILSDSPDYTTKNIETRVNLGDPGNSFGKNLTSYSKGFNGSGSASENSYDKITVKPLYRSSDPSPEDTNDLVKFRIAAIDNDDPTQKVYIHFRALLNNFNDAYDSKLNSREYVGRAEEFFSQVGFGRKISLNFDVVAQSKIELIPMYKKLNYLSSLLIPDYSKFGYMRSSIIQLTVGGYLYEQPGFITGLTYDVPEESTWEIGIDEKGESDSSVKELPHMIKVSNFSFQPIHNFIPRKQQNLFDGKGNLTKWGDEHFIALKAKKDDNYKQV